jgi:putative spermidine/putrescine transport system substrate-binding protein
LKSYFKKPMPLLSLVALLAMLVLAACGSTTAANTSSSSTTTTINLYADGDVNVQHLWTNTLIPAFEKAYPNIKVHLTYAGSGTSSTATFARLSAAVTAKRDSGMDILDSGIVTQAITANLMTPITTAQVPNLSRVDPALLQQVNNMAVPYRGSSVVLAYNSTKVTQPPTTLAGLLSWIKAHPGEFTYNTPDSGGSGQGFVQRVLNSHVSTSDENTFITGYDPKLESQWNAGLQDLKSLQPAIYQHGFYPSGNDAVLQLLANGSIQMAPVWSDQALSALSLHQLPANIKLLQITPAFDGGPAYMGIPRYSAHPQQAETLLNWLLTAPIQGQIINIMHGYPGVQWSYIDASVRNQYASIAKSYSTGFSNKFSADMNQKWHTQVAGS